MRVTNTASYREISFNLLLYPLYDQDPVSVPFRIEIFPCNSESLTTSNPPQLLLSRTETTNNFVQNSISPDWLSRFVSSNPQRCPVINFELLDTSNNVLANPSVVLRNALTPMSTRIDVRNDVAMSLSVRLKGSTNSKSTYFTLSIRVCGTESISLVNSNKKNYIYGVETGDTSSMSDSTRFLTIS